MPNNMDYNVDYNDERFATVESEKQEAIANSDKTYDGMIDKSSQFYQDQINASKDWANTQQQLQQDSTDFTIEQIEQQKDQANKDYVKQQSAAYTDYKKQSSKYGAMAEQTADSGLMGSGYSESSQVSMYNTYQNRVAAARQSYDNAVLNYNNAIKEAQLQNSSVMAEIAFNALQQQLSYALQGFQYENQLIMEQANKRQELDNTYYNRYQDIVNQINNENAMKEQIRQYEQNYAFQNKQFEEGVRQYEKDYELQNKQLEEEIRQYEKDYAFKKEQFAEDVRQYEKDYAFQNKQYEEAVRQYEKDYDLQMQKFTESIREFDEEIKRLKDNDAKSHAIEIQQLELQKEQFKHQQEQLKEEKRQFDLQYELEKSKEENSSTKINKDGMSSNQPTSIDGYGEVTNTGDTILVGDQEIPIWKTSDGTWWYWNGSGYVKCFEETKGNASSKDFANNRTNGTYAVDSSRPMATNSMDRAMEAGIISGSFSRAHSGVGKRR